MKIYFSIDGPSIVDLRIAPVLFVSFGLPAITPDEFFNDNILGKFFTKDLDGIEFEDLVATTI